MSLSQERNNYSVIKKQRGERGNHARNETLRARYSNKRKGLLLKRLNLYFSLVGKADIRLKALLN